MTIRTLKDQIKSNNDLMTKLKKEQGNSKKNQKEIDRVEAMNKELGNKIKAMSEEVIEPNDNLGYSRNEMPQIDFKHLESFLSYLQENKVTIIKTKIKAKDLKPIQKELETDKADRIWKQSQKEKDENINPLQRLVFVSKDNRLLDGHHRWLAAQRNKPEFKMNCLVIDKDVKEALKLMHSFDKTTKRDIKDKKIAERILEYTAYDKKTRITSTNDGHYHQYRFDTAGNGLTTFVSPSNVSDHYHEIKDYKVLPANGHSHTIENAKEENYQIIDREFKTPYGFEHWFSKREQKRIDKDYNGKVKVAGKIYGSPDEAAKKLLRRQ